MAYFPRLAAGIINEVFRYRMNHSDLTREFGRTLSTLREKNPYAANGLPEYSQRQREILDELVEEEKAQRREAETLYVLGPQEEGLLVDEGVIGSVRSCESLDWAIQRLVKELGFSMKKNGNSVQFVRDLDEGIAFADPRIEGKIEFYVYRRGSNVRIGSQAFSLPDRWKNDLEEKVLSGLQAATARDA